MSTVWLILLGVAVFILFAFLDRHNRKQVARHLVETIRVHFSGRHEYRIADPARFPHLDHAFYKETARLFEGAGFRRLGDLENVSLNESPYGMGRTFIRSLSGDGGTIQAGIHHVVLTPPKPDTKELRTVDLSSDLSDGVVLATTNAALIVGVSQPPEIQTEQLPGTAPLDLLEIHRRRLSAYLTEHPEVAAKPVESLDQLLESIRRTEDSKAEHRRSLGGAGALTLDELRHTLGDKFSEGELHELAKEIERLRETP